MSEENVELVRKLFEAFNGGGVEAALRLLPPDVVWYPFPEWVEESEYRGYDGIRRVMAVWTENFDEYAVDVHQVLDAGDQVVALIEQAALIKGSPDPVRQPVGALFSRFSEGVVGEAHYFMTWKEALEAAGPQGSG